MTAEERKKYHRDYYRENAEHLRKLARKSYRDNPESRKRKSERSKERRASRTSEQIEAGALRAKEYNQSRPELCRQSTKNSVARKLVKFTLLKSERPCYDCGGVFPPEAMDWDHKPGTNKLFDIAKGIRSFSEESVIDEILKCQLVCSNCHRVRTSSREKEKI